MKPSVRVAFVAFWPEFTSDLFRGYFPFVYEKYDLVLSPDPEVVFYSVFSPQYQFSPDPRHLPAVTAIRPGNYLRVFLTGENFEPDMTRCDFAITFSALTNHANHLRLPLWVYENRGWGFGPERLLKRPDIDWERVAREKTRFCSFVYKHSVPYRNAIFAALSAYKHIDAAGACLNNMNGWTVPDTPNRVAGKVEFFRHYKFALAVENTIWPGYTTEKLVDPMLAHCIPIYVGDPQAHTTFNPASYIDFACFTSMKEMLEFVREVDNDSGLYLKVVAAPYFRNNSPPHYARDETILSFFDRILTTAILRRTTR
jgi:hypothetical protein